MIILCDHALSQFEIEREKEKERRVKENLFVLRERIWSDQIFGVNSEVCAIWLCASIWWLSSNAASET